MNSKNRIAIALALATLYVTARGQEGAPIEIPYPLSSGPHINETGSTLDVWTTVVDVPFAGTLQLGLASAIMGSLQDSVVVESLLDGEVQELHEPDLQLWRRQTAWFNGTRVAITLRLAPGSYGAIDIALVRAGPPLPAGTESLCGPDERGSSTDGRVCRILGNGGICTGWLVSEFSRIITAGHCVNCPSFCPSCASGVSSPGALVVAQFNVPQSTGSGAIVAPPIQHQYPVLSIDISLPIAGSCPESGNDWAIATLGPNSSGVSASTNQAAWFALANFAPAPGATVRVTGFGSDSGPVVLNFTQQSATGPVLNSANYYRYAVDTEGGTSGGPVMIEGGEADDQVVAINTNSGCTAPPTTGNGGTSLQGATIRAFLVGQGIVDNYSLLEGVSQSIVKANTWFSLAFGAGKWNAVTIVPDGDWDLSIANSATNGTGNEVTALLANGRLGSPSWTSGTAYRKIAGPGARLQHAVAETFTIGTGYTGSLSGSRLARLLEFHVPVAGPYDVSVLGTPGLPWTLLGPGADASWVDLEASTVLGASSIGGSLLNDVTLSVGWHALLVHRASSATLNSTEAFSVTVCASGSSSLVLQENVPTTVTNPCQVFVTPTFNNRWNVVSLASPSTWDTFVGTAVSQSNSTSNLVLADGRAGPIPSGQGTFIRRSGADPAVAEMGRATTSAVNTAWQFTLPAGAAFRAMEFNVPTAGTWSVQLAGPIGLGWRLFAPQASGAWIDIDDHLASGLLGGPPMDLPLSPGWHCIALHRIGSFPTTATSGTVNVCSSSVLALASGGAAATVTAPCQTFELAATAGVWDAAAITSDASTNWNLAMGTADATAPAGICDFAIADGHFAPIMMRRATVARVSGTGSGFVQQASRSTLTPGVSLPLSFNTSTIARIVEVPILVADRYDLSVTGNSGLAWDFFTPRANASWVTRASAHFATQSVGGPGVSNVPLQPGVHAIVIYRQVGTGAASCAASVQPTPHPVPALSSLSPSSTTAPALVPLLTLTGSGFDDAAQVRWNGTPIPTAFVSTNQLTATPPASLFSTGIAAAITVFNPAPGGGTSNPLTFTVLNPVPTLTLVSQSTVTAGGPGYSTTVIGSGFTPSTVIQWNGIPLTTVAALPPSLIDVAVPASLIAAGGTASLTAFSPAPGGGTSAPLTLTINNPVPSVSSISPSEVAVGGPAFSLTVIGSSFNAQSVVRLGTTNLTTTLVSQTQLQAAVPASAIATTGAYAVTVQNPAPGGGVSGLSNLSVTYPIPVLSSLNLSSVIAGQSAQTLVATGTGFSGATQLSISGTPRPTTLLGPTTLETLLTAADLAAPGSIPVFALNPAPGGGPSTTLSITARAPALLSLAPPLIPIQTLASPPVTLTITGADFLPWAVVYANGVPLSTIVLGSTLTANLPASILQAREPGGITINVSNGPLAVSNSRALVVGDGGNNSGTIRRHPLAPAPLQPYAALLEGGVPGAVFSLYVDLGAQPPVTAFPDANANLVLAVTPFAGSPGPLIPLIEGLGVFGSPTFTTLLADGSFALPGFVVPATQFGIDLTIQAAYLDASAPYGFRLTWARRPDQL